MRSYGGFHAVPWLVASTVAAALAAPLAGQDVTYTSRTSMDMGGAMNAIMNIAARMGGGSTETVEKQYIKGRRMRTDANESSSTILDMEGGRWLSLDHEARTYIEVSMDSLMAMAQGMARTMGQAGAAERAEPTDPSASEVDYSFDVSVDRTGREERIAGYQAEQVLLTIEMEARGVPEGEQQEQGGRMVLLSDLWVSTDVPGYQAMRDLQTEQGTRMAGSASDMSGVIGALGGQDPRQRAAMERAGEEMSKVEGMPVRTTMHMVMVPLDQPFDRDAVLEAQPQQQASGGGGVGGLVGGLLGRRRQEPPPQEQAPTQVKLLTVVDELIEVSTSSIPDSMFEVPEGYRRVDFGAGG